MIGQFEHYLALLQWGAYAAIVATVLGLANMILLIVVLTKQNELRGTGEKSTPNYYGR